MLNKPPQVLLSALAALQAEHEIAPPKIPDLLDEMLTKMPQMRRPKKKEPGYIHQGFENDRLFASRYGHIGGSTCDKCDPSEEVQRDKRDTTNPDIHYGIIASGNTLVKDASTRDKIAESAGSECLCVEMEAAGLMDHFPCLVIRGICDYADSHKNDRWHRYASATAAAYAKELLEYVPVKMLEKATRAIDLLKSVGKDVKSIQSTVNEVQAGMQSLDKTALNTHQIVVLDRLRVAEGASFDSYAQEHNRYCLPNTRVELLQQVAGWAKDPNAEPTFWLNGMAGTGKSTISRTVAKSFADNGQLDASFFFKKGEADRSSLLKFFMTIAADLVVRKPSTAPHIESALVADRSITSKNATEQFQMFLLEPLSKSDMAEGPVVIVVDALDECEQDDINHFLHLVSRLETELPDRVRIFMTSRPEEPFRSHFETIRDTKSRVILHEISQPVIEHDIEVFLRYELGKIRAEFNSRVAPERHITLDWPGQSTLDRLTKMAVPLFIVAATICRFISDKKMGTPGKLLGTVLSRSSDGLPPLETTYLSVLNNLTAGLLPNQQEQIINEFRHIVGPIILLASPLSTSSLAEVLGISKDDIDSRLDLLHSVLSIPASVQAPVRLLHLSFRDFLLNPNAPAMPFRINERKTHANLATHCLRMMGCLKEDMCNIKYPGTPRCDISAGTINSFLPPELQYSCLYWVYHLANAGIHVSDKTDAHAFLKQHFLHWVEALALIDRASESLRLLRILQSRVEESSSTEISLFLEDAIRLLRTYMSTINATPLQLYSSLLVFTPKQSKIRNAFEGSCEGAKRICLKPRVEEYWNNSLQTLEGHTGYITSVVFSPDSTLIASAACDNTIRIWCTTTGECLQTLEGHRSSVTSVVFSSDSKVVASSSEDYTVRIWRANTGECMHTLEGHSRRVESIDFSPHSTLVASGSSDHTVRIWHPRTGDCIHTLEGHSDRVRSVVFSSDSTLVASGSDDYTVRIWSVNTGECLRTLEGHSSSVTSVDFSSDSTHLASGSSDQTVRIWCFNTDVCVWTLEGHSNWVEPVVFSPDSILVASASRDYTVRLWCVNTGECVHTLEHAGEVESVDFSPDSTLVVSGSGSGDSTVRIWRTGTGECVQTLKGHANSITAVVFSLDSTLIASGSADHRVQIWDANIGGYMQTQDGHTDYVTSVIFSPDSTVVASSSLDHTVRIWCANTGECVQTLEGHSDGFSSVVFSPNSILLASGSHDKTVRIWRVDTGDCMHTLDGHSSSVTSVVFSPDSMLIASGSADHTVQIWCASTGECMLMLEGHSHQVESVDFSTNSTLVASGSLDHTVRIWCTNTGDCMHTLEGHSDLVRSVVFSADSTLVASGSDDYTVRIWNAKTGECVQTLGGHCYSVTSVAFSSDSTLVAASAYDEGNGTVRIWHANTGECVQTINIVHASKNLTFNRDASFIITDVGAIAISGGILEDRPLPAERSGIGIGINEDWITWDGKHVLWLPVEFRPFWSSVLGTTVVIGSHLGKVIIVRLSPDCFEMYE